MYFKGNEERFLRKNNRNNFETKDDKQKSS